ncbi:MAG: protein kinase [Isosphaeraceae bacterium]|nr:protein kinase [Isosphaeraceae bacterium]
MAADPPIDDRSPTWRLDESSRDSDHPRDVEATAADLEPPPPEELGVDPDQALRLLALVRSARKVGPIDGDEERLEELRDVIRMEIELRESVGLPAALEEWAATVPEGWTPGEAVDSPSSTAPEAEGDASNMPGRVAGFVIESELGRGGMGVVFKARQPGLARTVALKMIRDVDARSGMVSRLRREAAVLARLQHPNIVQIHEVGEWLGRPYLVLEYVAGGNLEQWLSGSPMRPVEAAELIEVLARAVQATHDAGIVHRDLKPANILLSPISSAPAEDGEPAAPLLQRFRPKISDFGLAKPLSIAHDGAGLNQLTHSGLIAGTPSYMAPEQAAGNPENVGTAADIYALGAIFYELLTARPPFRAATTVETLMLVVNEDPIPPGRLQPRLARDLETICLKCLAKDPSHRYASARELAEDLARSREGRSILARPAPMYERVWKWSRRRPSLVALIAIVGILIAAAPAVSVGIAYANRLSDSLRETRRAQRLETFARVRAEEAEQRMRRLDYYHRILLASHEWRASRSAATRALLEACEPQLRGWEWRQMVRETEPTGAVLQAPADLYTPAISPDGRFIAATCRDASIRLWNASDLSPLPPLLGHRERCLGIAFSPDGSKLATASSDRTVVIWEVASWKPLYTFRGHTDAARSVAFSPDGSLVASTGKDAVIRIWEPLTGKVIRTLPGAAGQDQTVVWSADGKRIAYAGGSVVKIFDARSGSLERDLLGHSRIVRGLSFSPDGNKLATASEDSIVRIWDLSAAVPGALTFQGHSDSVFDVEFSPDGTSLASSGQDTTVRIWDPTTGREHRRLQGHEARIYGIAWNRATGELISAGTDKTLRIWDANATGGSRRLLPTSSLRAIVWADGDRRLIAASRYPSELLVLDSESPKTAERVPLGLDVTATAASADGRVVAFGGADGTLRIYTVEGQRITALGTPGEAILYLEFTSDGAFLLSGRRNRVLEIWDLDRRGIAQRLEAGDAFGPAKGTSSSLPKSRLAQSIERLASVPADAMFQRGVAWDPDRNWVASSGLTPEVLVWDHHRKLVHRLIGHTHGINDVSWSPDGARVASASSDGSVRLWDPHSGESVLTLDPYAGAVEAVAWSRDGGRLAAACEQGLIIWDGRPPSPKSTTSSTSGETPAAR